mmetsp:Transcript_27767/g.65985  ORF Transcript_27767/g.65985 Transcript_27767/m.65985 type:complete len:204 (+) Transcript_27767:811-1422(+)
MSTSFRPELSGSTGTTLRATWSALDSFRRPSPPLREPTLFTTTPHLSCIRGRRTAQDPGQSFKSSTGGNRPRAQKAARRMVLQRLKQRVREVPIGHSRPKTKEESLAVAVLPSEQRRAGARTRTAAGQLWHGGALTSQRASTTPTTGTSGASGPSPRSPSCQGLIRSSGFNYGAIPSCSTRSARSLPGAEARCFVSCFPLPVP